MYVNYFVVTYFAMACRLFSSNNIYSSSRNKGEFDARIGEGAENC